MAIDLLGRAVESTRRVLVGVQPEDLCSPTPCALWSVAEVIDHLVAAQHFVTAIVNGEHVLRAVDADVASRDFCAAFDDASKSTVGAFASAGSTRVAHLPFVIVPLPVPAYAFIAATDVFVHGWDIARATGQSTDLDPHLADMLLTNARCALPASMRGSEGHAAYGPMQPAPPTASNADRLAAFLGRRLCCN